MIGVEKILTNIAEDTTPQLGGDLDFQKYKAVAMACDNGATLPTSPVIGQWFLHTPTGRSILMQYNGSSWSPIISYGTMTLYVDNTDGTDDQSHGTGVDADAFKTIQYAVDTIPGLVGGSVTININAETYAETVPIRGKNFIGDYNISIYGTLSVHDNLTATGTGQQGATTTLATFVDNAPLTDQHYNGQLIKFTSGSNNGSYRVIETNNTTTITLCGNSLAAAPQSGDTATVYTWGTVITSILVTGGQKYIYIYNCSIDNCKCSNSGYLKLSYCNLTSSSTQPMSADYYGYIECYFTSITGTYANGNWATFYAMLDIQSCLIKGWTTWGIYGEYGPEILISQGTVIDGITKGSGVSCVRLDFTSTGKFWCPNVYNVLKNAQYGVIVANLSGGFQTSMNNYVNNTTNESASAGSYSYID